MKNLSLLLFCFLANILFGQTKFDNEKLLLVQEIYHNSTKQNINSFMKNKGYQAGEIEKGDSEYGDLYSFLSEFNRIEIEYTTKDAILGVVMLYAGAVNNAFIEMDLKNAGYTYKEHEQDMDGRTIIKKQWTKKGQNISFLTYADSDEKIGFVGYGEFEE